MNWFSGSIAEAVTLSKAKNAIFVVYVEGKDELSEKLRGFINDEKIKCKLETDCFVAVRVEGGSEAYMQFAQIYQLVPLPSLFFIGKNGTPIEIATGVIKSVDELNSKIDRVLSVAGLKIEEKKLAGSDNSVIPAPANASADLISSEKEASSANSTVVCEGEVCYRKVDTKDEPEVTAEDETPKSPEETVTQTAEKATEQAEPKTESRDETTENVECAKQLLEEKRKEKEAEEARLERERELRRRKEGQEMQTLKKWQQEHELKELKDNIRKEKLEEQAARQRILEQIASDKAERAQRFGQVSPQKPEQSPAPKQQSPAPKSSHESFDSSRIQFKKPDGESEMHTFKISDTFQTVRSYVKNTLLRGTSIREFSLATAFPRKEFTVEDDEKTLGELCLCPTAVLLVITRNNTGPAAVVARSGGVVNIFNSIFWGILSPLFAAVNYIKTFFGGRRPPAATTSGAQKRAHDNTVDHQELAKQRNLDRFSGNGVINDFPTTSNDQNSGGKSVPYRRLGGSNVHRLRDHQDSDDENNTWNGNSTQQQ